MRLKFFFMASSLSAFLGEIGRHQLLTPEQELTLGHKVQAMLRLQERPWRPRAKAKALNTMILSDASCGLGNGPRNR